MRKQNLKYLIGIFILLLTFDISAQTKGMSINENIIDEDFVLNEEIRVNIYKQSNSENEINLVLERANDSLFSVYFINNSCDSFTISKQDWSLFLIQEAKNQNGEWKPVEFWQYSTCGNSYLSENIEPEGVLKTESIAYNGNFKTQVRFKLLNKDIAYYSNSITGFVNLSQFSIPKEINKYRSFKRIDKLGGSKLLNKVLFLEPNGMKEYGDKWESYLTKMAELREEKEKKKKN